MAPVTTIHWVNAQQAKLPVCFYSKQDNPKYGLDPKLVQDKLNLTTRLYPNADLSKGTQALIYRDEQTNKIDGLLQRPNEDPIAFFSKKDKESAGVVNVLTNMGRYLSGQAIIPTFAGKKSAPVELPTKRPLSLLA